MQRKYPDSEYLHSGNKQTCPAFRQITQSERFDCRFLFTTKVLDNGVNLKDKSIKHIIIEMPDIIEFIQCLGRKRICDAQDTIKLYFLFDFGSIAARYGVLKKDLQIANEYFT